MAIVLFAEIILIRVRRDSYKSIFKHYVDLVKILCVKLKRCIRVASEQAETLFPDQIFMGHLAILWGVAR